MKLALGTHPRSNQVTVRNVPVDKLLRRFHTPERLSQNTQDFHELPLERQRDLKAGPYITPCLFSGTRRCLSEATTIALIALDIDPAPKSPRDIMRKRIYDSPEILDMLLGGLQWIAHATASSTPENPRLRIFVVPEPDIPYSLYPPLVTYVASLLGLEAAPESRVAAQPMYFPRLPLDAISWFHSDLSGRPLEATDALDADSLTVEDLLPEDEFMHMVAPLDVSRDVLCSALAVLSADCDRLEWIKICGAIKHQFQGSEEGFEIFDAWSRGSSSKYTPEASRRQWDYEDANPKDRQPVTARSILHLAEAGGWSLPSEVEVEDTRTSRLAEESPECADFLERVGVETSLTALTTDYCCEVGRMQASSVIRQMLLDSIRRRAADISGRAVGRKELQQQASIARHSGEAEAALEAHAWARGWVFSKRTDEFITPTGEVLLEKVVNHAYARYLLADEAFFTANGRPRVMPSQFLLNIAHADVVQQAIYAPGKPPRQVYMDEGVKYYNLYSDEGIPEPVEDAEAEEIFMEHLKWILPDTYKIVLNFLAHLVQNTGTRVNWAILMKGVPGCGKTYFAQAMSQVLGEGNTDILNASIFQSQFCEWGEGKQLACIEEVRITGQNRFSVMDQMKPFITNDMISINRKFASLYSIPNVTSYMMFTNHEDALAISNDDRRYCILRCKPNKTEVLQRSQAGYFDKLFGTLYSNPGAVRHLLLNHPIEDFNATGHAPITKSREFMSYLSKSDIEVGVEELIEEDLTPLVMGDIVSSTLLSQLLETEKGLKVPNRSLSHALINSGWVKCGGSRVYVNEKLHTVWWHEASQYRDRQAVEMFKVRASLF